MKKLSVLVLSATMLITSMFTAQRRLYAEDSTPKTVDKSGYTLISGVESFVQDGSNVTLSLKDGNKIRITFIDDDKFRYYVNLGDGEFLESPKPNKAEHTGKIVVKSDEEHIKENKIVPTVKDGDKLLIETAKVTLEIDKTTSQLTVKNDKGAVVMQEASPIMYNDKATVQSLVEHENEYFYGGGTQNGRFSHKGKNIKIENTNNWVDGGVASPNPFYWSTAGYGVVRNTFKPGNYDFGAKTSGIVQTLHNENRFDAYYTVSPSAAGLINNYTEITGKPAELPEYAFYLSHLNCYNRDAWKPNSGNKFIDGVPYSESNKNGSVGTGELLESLLPKNGNDKVTAKRQIELHAEHNIPLGSFLPNDGYGCGYGQSSSLEGDLQELKDFVDYAESMGIKTGLWTQSNLWPQDPNNPKKGERDFLREVNESGVSMVKTDVAWVGAGYSMALDGVKRAYDIITEKGLKNNVVSLDGWAGTQRYAGIWSGDQTGGNWEYIRFHIPTYIGTGLSGQPYIGSDVDGIFGGKNPIIQTRDFQWKAFTPYMLDMDGWGSSQKNPWEFGEDNLSINRAYLKLKAMMMPYVNTMNHHASTTGIPMVRAMLLEEMNAFTLGTSTQYQYMWGDSFLVAPIYQNTAMDEKGNDVRNDIYLPGNTESWVDYFTGKQYRGGTVINNFDAPIWKTPIFVKNGAIIPMYPDHNNPSLISNTNPQGLDRSHRIVEVYPYKESSFESFEDDGITFNGGSIKTLYTSKVEGDKATITIGKSSGNYTGVITNRSNEVIVNVSKAPQSVTGNGVQYEVVSSKEAYDKASGNVYFYDANPVNIVSQFATEGTTYNTNKLTTSPKLYIKSTEKINVFENEFQVVVEGFENDGSLANNELNESLSLPQNFKAKEIKDSEITLEWDKVNEAKTYDIEIDGVVYSNINALEFKHHSLNYLTDYSYKIRSVNEFGYSKWSEELTLKTADNPYRNVPKDITASYTGGAYSGKPNDAVDLDFSTQFHSSSGANENTFAIDLKKVYELDKIEYVPRQDNFGNGTLNELILEYSVDGVHWKQAYKVGQDGDEAAWTYPAPSDERFSHTIQFKNSVKAQFLRFKTLKSVGNFFTAFEIIPYAKDVNTGQIGGDYSNSGAIDEGDMTFLQNYSGIRNVDSDYDYVAMADVNFDGLIDAYDINYLTRQLNGGVKDNNTTVTGKTMVVPSAPTAKKGDVVKYEVYGLNMSGVNAFSVEMDLNQAVHKIVSNNSGAIAQNMQSFAKPRVHSDGTYNNYATYANLGENARLSGTGVIATFEVEYLQDSDDTTLGMKTARFVGSNLSSVSGLQATEPTLPETSKVIKRDDIASLKFTNDVLTQDNGDNGSKLFQNTNFEELLFDGKKSELVEFKWFLSQNSFGPEVKLPTDFEIKLKEQAPVTSINIYNRLGNNSNGRINSIKAIAYSGDVAFDLGKIETAKDIFEFKLDTPTMIDRIVITPLSSSGKTGFEDQSNENRMLSLREIEIVTNQEVLAAGIESNIPEFIHSGDMTKVDAHVTPENVSNGLINVESSDESILTIKRVISESSYEYYMIPQKTGIVTVTVSSISNPSIRVEKQVEVRGTVDTSKLVEAIGSVGKIERHLYQDASLIELDKAVESAKLVLDNPESKEKVLSEVMKIQNAISKLVFKGSDETLPNSTKLIDSNTLTVHSYTNFADSDKPEHVIDKNKDTIWHTGYQSNHKLPVEIVIDLQSKTLLEQIDLLPSQRSRNGDITHYRIETSLDLVNWTSVVEGLIPNDGTQVSSRDVAKTIKFAPVEARYVKVIAKETLGAQNNQYASIAELSFYGSRIETIYADSLSFENETLTLKAGETINPNLIINPQGANEVLTWTSNDDSIAGVSNGVITGNIVGETTISVSGKNASATLKIVVEASTIEQLQNKVEKAQEYVLENPTLHEFLKTPLEQAIKNAKEVIESGDNTKVESALQELSQALENGDQNVHFVVLQDNVSKDLAGYDIESVKEFSELQKQGEALLSNVTSIEDVIKINEAFDIAREKLISLDKTKLAVAIEALKQIDAGQLIQNSKEIYDRLIDSIDARYEALNIQKDINLLETEILESIAQFEYKMSTTTREQLEEVRKMLKSLNLNNYSKKNQELIANSLKNIEALLGQINATDTQGKQLLKQVNEDIETLTTLIEKDFKGKPLKIKVGMKFTLYPDFDDQKGGKGWKFDSSFFVATFNSPATFTALKSGETTIEYTDSKGNVQFMRVVVEKADAISPETGGNTGSGNDSNTPGVSVDPIKPLPETGIQSDNSRYIIVGSLLLIGIGLVLYRRRKD